MQKKQAVFDYTKTQAQILFFVLALDGKIIDANRFAISLTGCRPGRSHFSDLVVDFAGAFRQENLTADCSKTRLLNIQLASGLPQSFYFNFAKTENEIMAFGRLDTRGIEEMQKQVLALNRELNNLTRQLHKKNAQLVQLNSEKNQFLGIAAHDLRKPIGLILTYSEFLIDEAAPVLTREQQGFLHTVNDACAYMKKLVDDFLDVSAIEAGRFDLDLAMVDMHEILDRSLVVSRLIADKKGVFLDVRTSDFCRPVSLDASKIEQAVTNLVSNAIEHSRPGDTVIIRLRMHQDSIAFSVTDTGPGIAREELEKVFKPFGKTSAKKTGREKSTGLGMAITHKIITSHQGELQVNSTPGKGTTITFTLPLKKEKINGTEHKYIGSG
ncbi:MAG: HAMP domain-containing sensor histidine kinase [Desulfotignum sp.]